MTWPRRLTVAGVVALTAVLLVGWLRLSRGDQHRCALIGGRDQLSIRVDPAALPQAASIRLRLCQDDSCEDLGFPTGGRTHGVTRVASTYEVDLDTLRHTYHAGSTATVTVLLLGGDAVGGAALLKTEESFDWTTTHADGRRCEDRPFLAHEVVLSSVG